MLQLQSDIEIDIEKSTLCWQLDLSHGLFKCDPQLANLLSSGKSELTLQKLFEAFDRRRKTELKARFKAVIDDHKPYITTILLNIYNQRYLVNLSVYYSAKERNNIIGEITFLNAFPSLSEETELVKALFNRASHGILITDKKQVIIKANQQFLRDSGYQKKELVGKPANILKSGQYNQSFYHKLWKIVDTEKIWFGELLIRNKLGEIYAHEIKIQRIELSVDNYFYTAECKKLDFSAQFLADNQIDLEFSKNFLLTKADLMKKMTGQFKRLSKNDTLITVAFSVKLLQKISPSMLKWLVSKRFNESNRMGQIGLISDDIFVAFWVIEKNADKINCILHEMLSALSGGSQANELDLLSIIKMGASILSVDAKSPQQLISHSVQTLITSLQESTSSLNYFDPRLSKRFNKRKILSTLLHQALQNNKLEVYYQPIVDMKKMSIVKFEALMRVCLDTDLSYDTQELIEIAEQYGWVDKIDMAVANIALQDLQEIRQHYQSPEIGIAINRSLSNDQISNCCLEDTLALLTKSNLDPHTITIELTESALFDNLNRQRVWVEKLRTLGISVALDDFGTGYSSFSYLSKLPVNIVKIDKSFVTDLTFDSTEYMMIEMLCRLTHKMGGKVIAEGVETANELELLSRAKVDMLQGYIFSKPISLSNILSSSKSLDKPELLALCYQAQQPLASDVMTKEFVSISADERLLEAKEAFTEHTLAYLVAVDNNRCRGVLTRADLDKALSPYLDGKSEQHRDLLTLDKRIHQVMHKKFYAFQENVALSEIESVLRGQTDAVIIINNDLGHCSGVITAQLLLAYYHTHQQSDS